MWVRVLLKFLLTLSLLGGLQARAQFVPNDLAIYVDPGGQESIDTIRALPGDRFVSSPGGLSRGYTRSVFWLRFTAQAPRGQAGEWWLEIQPPYLEDIRLYEIDTEHPGHMVERRAGAAVPLAQREAPYRGSVFRLQLKEDRAQVYHLRLQTASPSLALVKLWPARRFAEVIPIEYSLQGGFFVLLGAILLINLMLWISFRETIYLAFMGYLLATFMSTFTHQGLAAQFFPSAEASLINQLRNCSSLLLSAAAGHLFRSVLLIGPEQRIFTWLYRLLIYVPLAFLPLVVFGYFIEVMRVLSPYLLLMTLIALYRCWELFRQRVTGYASLNVATLFSSVGLLITVAQVSGYLVGNPIVIYSLQISALGNIIALPFVIIARSVKQEASRQKAMQSALDADARAQQENLARLEQATFISMLAHELKTPLAGIAHALDNAEILLGNVGTEVATRFERIRRALKRVNNVTDRYLQMDRGDHAIMRPQIQSVKLSEVIDAAVRQCPTAMGRLQVIPYDDITIEADAKLLSIALTNLIDNAAKYSPVHLAIDVLVDVQPGRHVAIDVADRGSGIPAQRRELIFQRYYRSPEHATIPGIGVGLALVQRIALLHGGEVHALERAGYASVFRLTIPVSAASVNVRN